MKNFLEDRRVSIDRIDSACLFILSERARLIFKIWLIKKSNDESLDASSERLADLEKIYQLVDSQGLRREFIESLFAVLYQRSQELFADFAKDELTGGDLIWHETADSLRHRLFNLDTAFIHLLVERFALVESVGAYKKANNLKPLDKTRWQALLADRIATAKQLGVAPHFVKSAMNLIHEEALFLESTSTLKRH